jgi:hypothetical protein
MHEDRRRVNGQLTKSHGSGIKRCCYFQFRTEPSDQNKKNRSFSLCANAGKLQICAHNVGIINYVSEVSNYINNDWNLLNEDSLSLRVYMSYGDRCE